MDWTYRCPHCRAVLNPDATVVLRADDGAQRFLAGLHPEPGDYRVTLPDGIEMEPGSRWTFCCPVCAADLASELNPDLCALDMQSRGDVHRVFFSRIAGEQATFVVSAEGLLSDHGIHTDRYVEDLIHRKYQR